VHVDGWTRRSTRQGGLRRKAAKAASHVPQAAPVPQLSLSSTRHLTTASIASAEYALLIHTTRPDDRCSQLMATRGVRRDA
jgi:hypothetical protein